MLVGCPVKQPKPTAHRSPRVLIPWRPPARMAELQRVIEGVPDAKQPLSIALEQERGVPWSVAGSVDSAHVRNYLGVVLERLQPVPEQLDRLASRLQVLGAGLISRGSRPELDLGCMREPGRVWKHQLTRPRSAARVILMQVGEQHCCQLGGRRPRRCQPLTESANQWLDSRPVAEEAYTKSRVDDSLTSRRLYEQAVVAARQRRSARAFSGKGGFKFFLRHSRCRCEELSDRWLPGRPRLAIADHRAVDSSN